MVYPQWEVADVFDATPTTLLIFAVAVFVLLMVLTAITSRE